MLLILFSCNPIEESTPKESIVLEEINSPLLPLDGCQSNHPPILFVHGFLAAGDGFDRHASRFASNGHCQDRIYALDWDNLDQEGALTSLSNAIDQILDHTAAEQLDVIGHSAGGGLSLALLSNAAESRIRKYIHVASSTVESPPSIPMLNLYSESDLIVNGSEQEGAENVSLQEEDHFAVITSEDSFAAMFEFLTDEVPQHRAIQAVENPQLWGKALDFGNNIPSSGQVQLFVLDSQTGRPSTDIPIYIQEIGDSGYFGPMEVEHKLHYEMRLIPDDGPIIHHFFPPFDHDNRLIRLRALPKEGIGAQFLSSLPLEDEASVALVNYSAHSGMIVGRDQLLINGVEQLNSDRANAENNTIALFHCDINSDQTEGSDPTTFSLFPFLSGTDTYWEPSAEKSISVQFNNNTLHVPQYGSGILLTLQ